MANTNFFKVLVLSFIFMFEYCYCYDHILNLLYYNSSNSRNLITGLFLKTIKIIIELK